MRKDRLLKALGPLCWDLETSFPAGFLSRMASDYLFLYTPTEVSEDIHMSSRLSLSTPVVSNILPLEQDRFKIIVIAYDYFSEFSLFCGLLSSCGLDILPGNVQSYSHLQRPQKQTEKSFKKKWSAIRGKPVLSQGSDLRRQIVDVFEVQKWVGKGRFDAVEQEIFSKALKAIVLLLGDGAYKKARERVNRRLIAYLAQGSEIPAALQEAVFHPIQVRFNNSGSNRWTLLEVRGKNTPIFVYFEKLVQKMIWFIDAKREGIFHIYTRLRPHGASGPLAVPSEKYSAYYSASGEAAPFERQALIKLRAVAGHSRLGNFFESVRDRFVYAPCPWDQKTALALRARQMDELVPKGMINVKYSPGGIVDIEYLAQYLQIRHGHRHPELRTPKTLMALHQLSILGVISGDTEKQLHESYLFLRKLIDALRIVRGNAKDLLLPKKESEEFTFLGRRMGYGRKNWERGRKRLEAETMRHMTQAHEVFRSLFMAL